MDPIPPPLIPALREKLADHLASPSAIWDNLPRAYEEVTGWPLDLASPHTIMQCQEIVRSLLKP